MFIMLQEINKYKKNKKIKIKKKNKKMLGLGYNTAHVPGLRVSSQCSKFEFSFGF